MSINVTPPTEKQLSYFHSLAKRARLVDPEVPTTKAAATMRIAELKHTLTTEELDALCKKLHMTPVPFEPSETTVRDARLQVMKHPSMQDTDHFHDAATETVYEFHLADRQFKPALDPETDAPLAFDGQLARAQQRLYDRQLMPIEQKHIDFELLRVNLLYQQRLTGQQATLADADASYQERYQTMLAELKRMKTMPTRRQIGAIKRRAEQTGVPPTFPKTRAEAGKMIEAIKNEVAAAAASAAPSPALDDQLTADLPSDTGDMSLKSEAYLTGGAGGTAYHPEEFSRDSDPYWQDEAAEEKFANLSPEERMKLREAEQEANLPDRELHDLYDKIKNEQNPALLRKSLPSLEAHAAAAQIPDGQLPRNGAGQIEPSTPEEALALLGKIISSRQNNREVNTAATDRGIGATAERGDWGDQYIQEKPTEKQIDFFEKLIEETGIRVRGSEEPPPPIESITIYENSVVKPETKREMSKTLDALVKHYDQETLVLETHGAMRGIDDATAAPIRAILKPNEQAIFDARFREGRTSSSVADELSLTKKQLRTSEISIAQKVDRFQKAQKAQQSAAAQNNAHGAGPAAAA